MGADPALRTRRDQRLSLRERGFSLPEVLIALAISSVLLLGAARFLPALQHDVLRSTRQLSLEEEIWQRIYTVAKQLQRAGYCRGRCTGEGLTISRRGECVIVQWDANGNGVWDTVPAREAESTGFRLNNQALETLRGATSCEGKGWEKMTDPEAIAIEQFQVERQNIAGFAPVITVRLRGASRASAQERAAAEYSVTGYNL